MTPYEKIVIEEAEKWFSDAGELLVWDWDHEVPGRCHPMTLVSAWEDGQPLPKQVSRRGQEFLTGVLRDEWVRSGLQLESIPSSHAWSDPDGRRVWLVNLATKEEHIRHAFGRALLRDASLPAWDFNWGNLVYPEYSKTCVISFDDGIYVYEPTEADLVAGIERLRPDAEEPNYLSLLYQQIGYFNLWLHPEGFLVEARSWYDLRQRTYTHWLAATVPVTVPCRQLGGVDVAEENFLSLSEAAAMALAWLESPGQPPDYPGIFWTESCN